MIGVQDRQLDIQKAEILSHPTRVIGPDSLRGTTLCRSSESKPGCGTAPDVATGPPSIGLQVLKTVIAVTLLAVPGATALGQNPADARGGDQTLWVGAQFSIINPDYSCSSNLPFACRHELLGVGAIANMDLTRRWSANAEARWLLWNGIDGETESAYLAGVGLRVWRHDDLSLAVRSLSGVGHIYTPGISETDFVYAPAGDLAWHIRPRGMFFVGYQYQRWPAFGDHGLTPNGFDIGFVYRVF